MVQFNDWIASKKDRRRTLNVYSTFCLLDPQHQKPPPAPSRQQHLLGRFSPKCPAPSRRACPPAPPLLGPFRRKCQLKLSSLASPMAPSRQQHLLGQFGPKCPAPSRRACPLAPPLLGPFRRKCQLKLSSLASPMAPSRQQHLLGQFGPKCPAPSRRAGPLAPPRQNCPLGPFRGKCQLELKLSSLTCPTAPSRRQHLLGQFGPKCPARSRWACPLTLSRRN